MTPHIVVTSRHIVLIMFVKITLMKAKFDVSSVTFIIIIIIIIIIVAEQLYL